MPQEISAGNCDGSSCSLQLLLCLQPMHDNLLTPACWASVQMWTVPDDLFSLDTGTIGPIKFAAHLRATGSAEMQWQIKPQVLYITVLAQAALAIDMDADNNGIGGPDHAVLIDLQVAPKLAGPKKPETGVHAWEIGGYNALSVSTSLYWKVGAVCSLCVCAGWCG